MLLFTSHKGLLCFHQPKHTLHGRSLSCSAYKDIKGHTSFMCAAVLRDSTPVEPVATATTGTTRIGIKRQANQPRFAEAAGALRPRSAAEADTLAAGAFRKSGTRLFFALILSLASFATYAQQVYTINGQVLSSADGQPLAGATIQVVNTPISTKADQKGTFAIASSQPSGKLRVSFISHQTKEVDFDISRNDSYTVTLDADENSLDEVQIVGYGQTTKRFNTGSVASISAKEIEQQPVTNVLSALSGRMPGVFVQTTNGLPGGNINIQVRGTGSIAAGTQPLFIIDGVPYDGRAINAGTVFASNNIVGTISPLNSINPSDIESISVLKDADATAIYGSRGANGVVLITTRGNKQQQQLSFDVNYLQGIQQAANLPRLMNMEEYLQIRREAFANDNRTPSADPALRDYAPDLTIWDTSNPTNWAEHFFGNTGQLSNLIGTLSGGSESTFFNVSGNFRRESTILPSDNNNYRRGGWHASLSHRAGDRFQMSLTNSYTVDNNRLANPVNSLTAMITLPPNFPVYNGDGSFNWYSNNPVASALATSKTKTSNMVSNLMLNYAVMEGLSLKLSAGHNKMTTDQTQLFPEASLYPGGYNFTQFGVSAFESVVVEPQVNYSTELGKSTFDVLLGGTYQSTVSSDQYIKATHFINETLMENLASAGNIEFRNNSRTEYKYASVFGRVTYNLLDRYLVNATFRRDGSSKFGPDNRFGNFGALGAAWIFSEEAFLKQASFLSYGKLRASYGTTGNDQIPDYQYLSTYGNSGYVYENISTLAPLRVTNDAFHWETTRKFETGIELGFFANRLLLAANHYLTRSSDQLVAYSIPSMTGFFSYQANLPAVVENRGFELQLDASLIAKKDFNWKFTFNATFPRNTLRSFEDFENSSYSNALEIGYDINRVYGFRFIGLNPETGLAGYADRDGEESTSPYNFHTIGKETPDYFGGVGTNLNIKNWEVSVFGNFAKKMSWGSVRFPPGGIRNNYIVVLDRWTPENTDTDVPKATLANDTRYRNSSANFYNTSFFRLSNINVSYTLPQKLSGSLNIRQMRIYGQVLNAFTFYDRDVPVVDPESGAMDAGIAPPLKSFNLGIQLTF